MAFLVIKNFVILYDRQQLCAILHLMHFKQSIVCVICVDFDDPSYWGVLSKYQKPTIQSGNISDKVTDIWTCTSVQKPVICTEDPRERISVNLLFSDRRLLPKIQYDTRDKKQNWQVK